VTETGGPTQNNVAMLRKTSIAILILAAGALGAVLLCVLALRVLLSAMFALSGIRRRMAHGAQVLDW
jgi:hypothetical protein